MATITLLPFAAGDNTEIPSQYPASGEHWDKVIAHDDSRYLIVNENYGGSQPYKIDLFRYDATVRGGKINSVTLHNWYAAASDNFGFWANALKTHGTIYYGDDIEPWHVMVFTEYTTTWALNPYTSSLWTWSEIYEMQFGVAMKGVCACDYVSAVVDYTLENVKPGLIDMGMM